jgi:hypothetical protein
VAGVNSDLPEASSSQCSLSDLLHIRLISKIPFPYPVTWLAIGLTGGGVAYLTVLLSGGTLQWILGLALGYAAVVVFAGTAIIWVWNSLNRLLTPMLHFIALPRAEIVAWHFKQMRAIFNTSGMTLTGLTVVVLGMASFVFQCQWFSWPVVWFGTDLANLVVVVVASTVFWLAGTALWMLVRLALMVITLSKLPLILRAFQDPVCGICVLGRLFLRISLILVSGYTLMAVTAMYLSPFRCLPSQSHFVLGWLAFGAVIVLAFFIVPQYGIHVAMVRAKHEKLHVLAAYLSSTFEEVISNPKPERTEHVEKLVELHSYLNKMPEWPFDTKVFASVISAIILPVGLAVLQMLCG